MEQLLANLAGKVQRKTLHGREYLVAPLSLIVPGVLNGSRGPLLYPQEEIQRNHSAWNNMPIVVYHPVENGSPVSARQPAILDKSQIGTVFNATANGKLTAEGWFDVELMKKVDTRVLNALQNGQAIELSTGLFTENEKAPDGATHNGVAYTHIARNYRPDHLAILPDMKGACSLLDGCGVLVNDSKADKKTLWTKLGSMLGITDNSGDGQPSGSSDNPVTEEEPTMKKLTDNERKAIVDELVANCDCWKGSSAEDIKILNGFSDEKLTKLKEQHEQAKKSALAANAAAKGIEDKEGNQYTFNAETGKWDLKPAAPKKEETAANTGKETILTPTTDNRASRLTPEEQRAIDFANNQMAQQKGMLIGQLIANLKNDADKKQATAVYNAMSLEQLEHLVRLQPKQPQQPQYMQSYAGQQGYIPPTDNAEEFDEDDILPLPTMNWEELRKEQSNRDKLLTRSAN